MNTFTIRLTLLTLAAMFVTIARTSDASATISFVSATNSAVLSETVDDGGNPVFVFDGTAEDGSTVLTFSTDSACPGVAMTGGAEFGDRWTCNDGVITVTVTDRGGLSFGPGPEKEPGTFYVTFSNPPTPPGADSPAAALSGIQISVFGDIRSWDLDGSITSDGALFGVELSGPEGGDAHFRMDLPQAAADFLGGVLGVFIGGKPDPFATVVTNEDGSVSIDVDIVKLVSAKGFVSGKAEPKIVTKKITAGERSLSIGFDKLSAKTGKSVAIKACAGTEFASGDKLAAQFTLGSSALSLRKTLTLDSTGCGRGSLKLKSVQPGKLTAKVTYKGKRAKATLKVTK